jgi:hypothetical protein
MGFVLQPAQAQELIQRDPRNREVLFPYLNGEDLNSRPDCSASRWVINFHDWSEGRARSYSEVFEIVERLVKPERAKNNRKVYRDYWWQYGEKRPAMLRAIADLDRVLVVARISRTAMTTLVPTNQVVNEKVVVFATSDTGHLALLDSAFHVLWAWRYSATRTADLQYAPSDVYETLPHPGPTPAMTELGALLHRVRAGIMQSRGLGLTKLYNAFHSIDVTDSDLQDLRRIHAEVDAAVAEAYGWSDLDLGHGFHETRQGLRYTLKPTAQAEVLDRLLELNHQHNGREVDGVPPSGVADLEDRISRSQVV